MLFMFLIVIKSGKIVSLRKRTLWLMTGSTFPAEIGSLYQKRLEICVSTRK
jgi:hypothetical protein